jgi:phage protein U
VGTRDASQYTGIGDDTITLNGMVAADNGIGTVASLDDLAKMGDDGNAYVLVDGGGHVYGAYVIESLNETATFHTPEGVARKIEFNLTLKRVADETLASTQGDGSETQSAAKELIGNLREVGKVATTVVDNVKNLSVNSLKSAAIGFAASMAPQAATAALKGLSTASGMDLDAAVKAAKQVSAGNGDAISSVVAFVLDKASGAE